jgi:hypothetical protein
LEQEIEQPFRLKELRHFLVSFAGDNLDLRLTTQGMVPTNKLKRVLLEGDDFVRITVKVKNRDIVSSER